MQISWMLIRQMPIRWLPIHYLTGIQNKERNNIFVPYSLFYKTNCTLERQLRKLYVSAGTAAVFTRIANCSPF